MDEQDLGAVVPSALALFVAIQASRLYPSDNPVYLRAKASFDDALHTALQTKRSIRFVVGKDTLFFGGERLLDDEHGAAVASELHEDGVREIAFHRGLTVEESEKFLAVFRPRSSRDAGHEDIITILWEQRFSHITYVAIDELFDPDADMESVPLEFGRDFMGHIESDVYAMGDIADEAKAGAEQTARIIAQIRDGDVDLFSVTEEERSNLLQELEAESEPSRLRRDFSRILVEILLLETDEAEFVHLVEILSSVMVDRIGDGNLREVAWLLSTLVKIQSGQQPGSVRRSALDEAVQSAWNSESSQAIRTQLDDGVFEAVDGIGSLLKSTPDSDLQHAFMLLGDLDRASARRRLVDLLVERCGSSARLIAPHLKDERWYLVRNVLLIVGRIGDRRAVPAVLPLLVHEEMRVRREALHALDLLDPNRSESFLREALTDREVRVRMFAAAHLASRGEAAIPHLVKVIQAGDFEKRDIDEIGAFYEALADAGGAEAVPVLLRIAKKKNLLRIGRKDEIKAAACRALGRTGGSAALKDLQSLSKDRCKSVREAAESSLAKLSTSDQKRAA